MILRFLIFSDGGLTLFMALKFYTSVKKGSKLKFRPKLNGGDFFLDRVESDTLLLANGFETLDKCYQKFINKTHVISLKIT